MNSMDAIFQKFQVSTVHQAAALFNQQLWCWGRDVLRPQGNYLTKIGFQRIPPTRTQKNCSSVYTLDVNASQHIILRGFGVYWGDDRKGGIMLSRSRFRPTFFETARLPKPCWSLSDLPTPPEPTIEQRSDYLSLLTDTIDWIREYEANVLKELGVPYREQVLRRWNDGKRLIIPPEEVPTAWRQCSMLLERQPEKFLPRSLQHA